MSADYLFMKWGTITACHLSSEKAQKAFDEFILLGVVSSPMFQVNTDRQKELICEIIDECTGQIHNDWSNEDYTKEQAKKYIMEYRT